MREILISSNDRTKASCEINPDGLNFLANCLKLAKLLKTCPILAESVERFYLMREEVGLVAVFDLLILMITPVVEASL